MSWSTMVRRRGLKRLLRSLISVLRHITPTGDHVLVYGWPQDEGNAVELVRFLGARGTAVRWLLDADPSAELRAVLRACPSVHAVRRMSLRGFVAFLTARVTFFTHGLYLSAPSPARKTVVNLWHGDGPKRNFMPNGEPPPSCDYVVSCSSVFGRGKAEFLGLAPDHLLVTGNPRNDRLFRAPQESGLEALGLQAGRYVVCMPTYRSARALGSTVAWQDTADVDDPRLEALANVAKAADQAGLQVVVKPHPLDAVALAVSGARVLVEDDLTAAGLNSYELLAASHCLVTDYSSIWTDYLSTGKHVAFAVPDWDAYAATRGLDQAVERTALPGPVVTTVDDVLRFFDAVASADPALEAQRERAVQRFGLVTTDGNCRRLVDALARRGVRLDGVA